MFRARTALCWILPLFLAGTSLTSGLVTKADLESEYGPIQGQMVMGTHTVLVFETVQVKFHRETGVMNLIPLRAPSLSTVSGHQPLPSSWMELKRRIARLPAHEQVRYWKLYQVRHPDQNVTSELEAALDKMESVRQQSMVARVEVEKTQSKSSSVYRRSRSLYSPYFPSYGYTSSYRFRRAIRKDTQIALDRIQRVRRPVESLNTAMSMADRARSDALSKVSGARSAILGSTR